nr:MAG TPA: hypothetical protein [Bacteriophage sp.]
MCSHYKQTYYSLVLFHRNSQEAMGPSLYS